jgi:enoyl-CoA hydratase/3-hydroxyacyl-CoA dehydrogenase
VKERTTGIIIPGGGGTQRLVRLLGPPRTKELVFTGNHISAEQAADWGIINRSVPDDALDETIAEFVASFTDGPQTALKVAKRVIDEGSEISLDAGIALEGQGFGLLTTTDDIVEGVQAFRQDRDPQFED